MSHVVADESSSQIFSLRDSAGQVLLNPDGVSIDDPVKSHDVRTDRDSLAGRDMVDTVLSVLDNRSDEEIEVEEWIIPVDEALYVRGNPVQTEGGLVMNEPEDGLFLISIRSEEELAGSAKLWATVATVAGALAALGGIALIVAGAAS